MDKLSELLNRNDSELARFLRLSLHGLRASLAVALDEATTDPGANTCRELLKELDQVLDAPKQSSIQDDSNWNDPFEPVNDPFEPPVSELKLSRLRDAFLDDGDLVKYLGHFRLESKSDADLWKDIQQKLLRLPSDSDLAHKWRERVRNFAHEVGAEEDTSERSLIAIPFSEDKVIYPGLTGTIKASGLCWSSNTPLEPRIADRNLKGDLYFLAGVVSTCIKFIELDPSSVHHALKSVYRFGVMSLASPEESSRYITTLIDRFQRVKKAQESLNLREILRTRLDLDEAIHSLVYQPPADRDSWWGKLQQESRSTLEPVVERLRQEGFKVQIRRLWGTYADIYTLSKDDLELHFGGIPGEVLACLRVYAKINEEVLSGRVLFRSLR
ncbi:MAG: hypothetical protein F6K10_14520 [Moorea sp. SIO2B7]|nr:hypothetical protein [Moorena sp. SIO2B7]